ncbi:AAA family ATPase [Actinoplanes sp. Pm04-4]|uniref:AAA family ATPase n=1 Tax=Paractinoplanes pyxinae TaxID=2997416 RepID=A0ABT4B6Y4_9ACTN|nr:AAA family ATPase [Actinoplanes pyxinae]MCY1142280.1 AAA family ATPase [Actinoplanes pyxinae]
MESDGLFSLAQPDATPAAAAAPATGFGAPAADSPLPVRMRPASLDELVGQEHLLAPGAPLRQLVTGASPMSVILWGPPGTGKTTIAHLVAGATNRKFVAMSALSAGVKDVRAVIDTARRERRYGGPPTVLFIDEVHRFSKTQQDSLLAAVEDRTVTLLAATTENPYFSVISPLLSRCVLLTLQALDDDDVRGLLRRAVTDERGLGGAVTLSEEAEEHLVRLASGDVRKALTALEAAAGSAVAQGVKEIDLATAEKAVDVAAVRYDRDGDAHYDVTSAFIKSMRGSDPDAALHWLARMLVAGEDPRFIARRIVIFASEDVGMADPQALLVATAAAQAVQLIGLPEAGLNLAQAVIHMATAPKSNSATTAIGAAMADVRAGRGGAVPSALRDAHYPGARGLGHGRGYRYPHDDPRGVVKQQYLPDDLADAEYYQPTDHGAERAIGERVPRLRRIVRGVAGTQRTGDAPAAGTDRAAGGAPAADEGRFAANITPDQPPTPIAADPEQDRPEPAGADPGSAASDGSATTAGAGTVADPGSPAPEGTDRTDDSGSAAGEEQP